MDEHVKSGKSRVETEKNRMGFTSQTVCGELCRRWKFADELTIAVEQSAEPLSAPDFNAYAGVVHLARFIAEKQVDGLSPEAIVNRFPTDVAEKFSLSMPKIAESLPELLTMSSKLEGLLD